MYIDYAYLEKNNLKLKIGIEFNLNNDNLSNKLNETNIKKLIYDCSFKESLFDAVFEHYFIPPKDETIDNILEKVFNDAESSTNISKNKFDDDFDNFLQLSFEAFYELDKFYETRDTKEAPIYEDCHFSIGIHKNTPFFEKPGDWLPCLFMSYHDVCGLECHMFVVQDQYNPKNKSELYELISDLNYTFFNSNHLI